MHGSKWQNSSAAQDRRLSPRPRYGFRCLTHWLAQGAGCVRAVDVEEFMSFSSLFLFPFFILCYFNFFKKKPFMRRTGRPNPGECYQSSLRRRNCWLRAEVLKYIENSTRLENNRIFFHIYFQLTISVFILQGKVSENIWVNVFLANRGSA